ncbi:MAG: molybdopterin-dependent oxidoreductase [Rhodobacteraceae bacterium]|jgi:hypothetical protein|nr:molybdopterin-dependent oxidoreductase [Paracoccaceae bacterium]
MNLKFRLINLFMFLLLLGPGNGLFFAMSLAGTSSTASQVVLTVEHEDKQTHLTVLSKFTLADLMLLPATKFTTSTIWTAEDQTFTGVELSELIKHLEIKGNVLHAIALDEYYFDLPMTDAVPGGAIVAYLNNGKRMTVREKGPLWIVYPYDKNEKFQTEEIYARSVWSLWKIIAQ